MGLAISVGSLAFLKQEDPEGFEHEREAFRRLNGVLARRGLPAHDEPEVLPAYRSRARCRSFPYSFLHYLRRAAAYAHRDRAWRAAPLPEGAKPTDDPVLESRMFDMESHLLCHSDCEGYYLPIDFADVVFGNEADGIPGGMLGSTCRLMEELVAVAPALGVSLTDGRLSDAEAERINDLGQSDRGLYRELTVWIALYEAARLSLEHKTAVCYT